MRITNSIDALLLREQRRASARDSMVADVVLTVGSRLLYAASQAAILVLVARVGGTEETASFIWALALTAPVFMFSNMNLREMISTETTGGFRLADYWRVRLVGTAGALALLSIVVPFAAPARQWPIIVVVAIGKSLESIHDLILGTYHGSAQAPRAAISLTLRTFVGCTCLAMVLALTASVTTALAAMFLGQFAIMLCYDAPYTSAHAFTSTVSARSNARTLVRTALPLGAVACLSSLSLNVPRYVVNYAIDDHALAAFGCCCSFLQVVTLAGVSAQLAISPRLADANARSRGSMTVMLWRNVAQVGCLGAIPVVIAGCWGSHILGAIYGPSYADSGLLLTWLMVGGAFSAAKGFLATGLTATRRTPSQAIISAAQLACSAGVCLSLLPRYGVVAAGWAIAASSAVSFFLHAVCIGTPGQEATIE